MIDSEKHTPIKCAAFLSGEDKDGQKWMEQPSVPGCLARPRPCGLRYGCCVEAGGPTVFPGSPVPTVAVVPILES